jgi:hypothetical protein
MRASGQRWRRIATLQQGRPEKAANLPVIPTQSEAAQLLNVFERTVRSATVVRDKGTPALQKAVEQGHLPVSAAAQATKLSPEQQQQIVQEAAAGHAGHSTGQEPQGSARNAVATASGVAASMVLRPSSTSRGFSVASPEDIAQGGFVLVAANTVRAGVQTISVLRLRITAAGRKAIEDAERRDGREPTGPTTLGNMRSLGLRDVTSRAAPVATTHGQRR